MRYGVGQEKAPITINNPAASSGVCCLGKELVSGFNTLFNAPRGGVLNPSPTIKSERPPSPQSPHFEDTIAAVLEDYPAGVYLAAVSGGADSTAMLAALAAVRDGGAGFQLRCIHVEHGIRPADESRGDAAFVRSLCEKLQVPCRVVSIAPGKIAAAAKDRGMGIEAAARLYRRRAWFREAVRLSALRLEAEGHEPAAVRVLTAHTADDMRETVLMRILRGAGPSGLAAMPVSRGRILRPLITLSRCDVLDYLNEKNIFWREDSTNTDTQFLRNRIRHCLIPSLNEHFPQWRVGVAALGKTQSLIANFIQREAASRVKWGMGSGEEIGTGEQGLGTRDQGLGTGDWGLGTRDSSSENDTASVVYSESSINNPSPQSLYTNAEIFFAQPPIIREEALFQGIDRLLPSARSHTIKRKNIRRFCEGNITAIDLGPLRLTKDSRRITLSLFSDPRSRIRLFNG